MSEVQSKKPKIISGPVALLAGRYAQALLSLAAERNALDAVAADLGALQEAIAVSPSFQMMAKHPRVPHVQVVKVINAVAAQAKFHDLTSAFLLQIVRGRRLSIMARIIDVFLTELAAMRGEHTAYVTAAKPLSESQKENLAKQLGVMIGGTVQLAVDQDESLMGGLVIKVGSRLIDASIKGKLARIERQLKTQQEAA